MITQKRILFVIKLILLAPLVLLALSFVVMFFSVLLQSIVNN